MIGTLVGHDVRLQARNRFYAAYAFVCVTYIVLLRLLPADVRALLLPPTLLSEASMVGFFFAGAMLHYERGDGVLEAIAVSPLSTGGYLAVRVLSLTMLNTAVALVIVLGAGVPGVRPALLGVAAAATGMLFTLLGTAVASRFASIEGFLILGGLVSTLFGLPVLPYFGWLESALWRVVPTDAALRLLAAGTADTTPYATTGADIVLSTAVLIVWCAAVARLAVRWLDDYALGRRGTAA